MCIAWLIGSVRMVVFCKFVSLTFGCRIQGKSTPNPGPWERYLSIHILVHDLFHSEWILVHKPHLYSIHIHIINHYIHIYHWTTTYIETITHAGRPAAWPSVCSTSTFQTSSLFWKDFSDTTLSAPERPNFVHYEQRFCIHSADTCTEMQQVIESPNFCHGHMPTVDTPYLLCILLLYFAETWEHPSKSHELSYPFRASKHLEDRRFHPTQSQRQWPQATCLHLYETRPSKKTLSHLSKVQGDLPS